MCIRDRVGSIGNGKAGQAPVRDGYLLDERILLKAIPDTGWRFVRWDGDFSGTAPEGEFNIQRDSGVDAVFEPLAEYAVTTVALGGAVTGGGTYYEGTEIVLTATADAGWTFQGWSGDHQGTEPSFPWRVSGPANFVAGFATPLSTLVTGPGRVELDPILPSYPYGTRVKVLSLIHI